MERVETLSLGVLALVIPAIAGASDLQADLPPSAFAQLEGYVGAEMSPDGGSIAYLHPVNERLRIHVFDLESREGLRIPAGDEMDYEWLRWANDTTLVFAMSYTGKRGITETLETRLLAFDIDSGEITQLIKPAQRADNTANSRIVQRDLPPPQLQDNVIDWVPDDPNHILVSLDEDQDGAFEVRKVHVGTGDYEIVKESDSGIQNWIVDGEGDIRFGWGYRGAELKALLKSTNGEWIRLPKIDWFQHGWTPHGFSDDPSRMIVIGAGSHETMELRVVDIGTGEFDQTLFSNPDYDVEAVVRHPLTGRPAGYSYITDQRVFEYFDTEMDGLQKSLDKALPGKTNRIVSMSADRRQIVFESSGPSDPGAVYIWNRDTRSLGTFGIKMAELDPQSMRPVEPVSFTSEDGLAIPAYLTLPDIDPLAGLPAIVLPHGGPAARDDRSFWFLSQFLASRGYAVLQPNFRGSSGYGVEFENAGQGQWGGLMQDDLTAGAKWLIERGIADKDRICIAGWSYGGYAAAMGLIKTPNLFRCGISVNGVYNLPEIIVDGEKFVGGAVWTKNIGLAGESAKTVSPFHQADRIEAPLLLIHAEDDSRVPYSQAKSMHKRLKKNDRPASLIRLPGGGHNLQNSASRTTMLEAIETFLTENNPAN